MHVLIYSEQAMACQPVACSERYERLVMELANWSPEDQAKMSIASVEVLE